MRWRRRRQASIYDHIVAHIEPGAPGLTEGGDALPDEHEAFVDGLAWAPGALEGAFSRYGGRPDETEVRVRELHRALLRVADEPGPRTRAEVAELFRVGADRFVMDDLIEQLRDTPPVDQARLYTELHALLLETGNREELKFALALVGAFGNPNDADIVRALARHEEFTLYAAVALSSMTDDPVGEWLALLPDVSGWGSTELSELLVAAEDDRAHGVLLRRGSAIGNALLLAVGCRLHDALAADEVDDDLLRGAQSILNDLTWSHTGPETLDDYPDAGPAVERFLEVLGPRASTPSDLITAYELGTYLDPPTEDTQAENGNRLVEAGFDDARADRVRELSRAIVERPGWRAIVEAALESEDEGERGLAIEAARRLGLPLHDYLVRRIEADPNDATLWFHFAYDADAERLGEAVRLAERVLDLDALASGAALELFGPPAAEGPHQAAGFVLQELPRFPGVGEGLLVAALESPVIRHRLIALRAFSGWPRELLRDDAMEAVKARLHDPADDVRVHADAVLRGEPIPEPSFEEDD
jgi:hypothetical protein